MLINLTGDQKQIIKWLVEKREAGKLEKEFLVLWSFDRTDGSGEVIQINPEGEKGQPHIAKSDLIALVGAGLLVYQSKASDLVFYALTQKAFDAVANNFQESGTLITDLKALVTRLRSNLNSLKEREAKYSGNVPVELLNEIDDHKNAAGLIHQVIDSATKLQDGLGPLVIDSHLKASLLSILGEK